MQIKKLVKKNIKCLFSFSLSFDIYKILTSFISKEFKNNLNWERIQNDPTPIHRSQQYPNRNSPQVQLIRLRKNQVLYQKKQNPRLQCRWPLQVIINIPLPSKYFPLNFQEDSHNSICWLHWPPTTPETSNWPLIMSNFSTKTPSFPVTPTSTTWSLPFIYFSFCPHTKTKNSTPKSKPSTLTTSKTSTSHTSSFSTMPFNKVPICLIKATTEEYFSWKRTVHSITSVPSWTEFLKQSEFRSPKALKRLTLNFQYLRLWRSSSWTTRLNWDNSSKDTVMLLRNSLSDGYFQAQRLCLKKPTKRNLFSTLMIWSWPPWTTATNCKELHDLTIKS